MKLLTHFATIALRGVSAGAVVLATLAGSGVGAAEFDGVNLRALVISQPQQLDCLTKVADEFKAATGANVELVGQGYANLRDAAPGCVCRRHGCL